MFETLPSDDEDAEQVARHLSPWAECKVVIVYVVVDDALSPNFPLGDTARPSDEGV